MRQVSNTLHHSLAILAVNSAEPVGGEALAEAWNDQWPDQDQLDHIHNQGAVLSFHARVKPSHRRRLRQRPAIGAVSTIPTEIPQGDLQAALARSGIGPKASERLAMHRAHMVVTVLAPNLSAVQRSKLLTRILVALLNVTDTAGVYWGSACIVIEPDLFFRTARQAVQSDSLPLDLWANVDQMHSESRASAPTAELQAPVQPAAATSESIHDTTPSLLHQTIRRPASLA